MKKLMVQLKECLELSVKVMSQSSEQKARINKYWQDFLKHLLNYVKKREKETGENILGKFSLASLIKFIK